jgi:hypothetical protein
MQFQRYHQISQVSSEMPNSQQRHWTFPLFIKILYLGVKKLANPELSAHLVTMRIAWHVVAFIRTIILL